LTAIGINRAILTGRILARRWQSGGFAGGELWALSIGEAG
jgi:hypothetical protein